MERLTHTAHLQISVRDSPCSPAIPASPRSADIDRPDTTEFYLPRNCPQPTFVALYTSSADQLDSSRQITKFVAVVYQCRPRLLDWQTE